MEDKEKLEDKSYENAPCCAHCPYRMGCMHGCFHHWNKRHMIRKIVIIFLIIIAFCLGARWGEMKSERGGGRFERGGMMNWQYNQFQANQQKGVGSVTVDVNKIPTTPVTPQ